MYRTIAEGKTLDTLRALVRDKELPTGTKVRVEMKLRLPVAHVFDLAGAEYLFKLAMPEGLILKDVYSPDNKYQVVIEAEANSPTILAIIAFIKAHWLAISLITIGLTFALGQLVEAIKIKADDVAMTRIVTTVAITAGIISVVYFISKAGIEAPGLKIGG